MGDWEGQAACIGKQEMFEITDRESRFRRDIKNLDDRDRVISAHNRSKFAVALSICTTCPVISECEQSIEGEDAVWTVRAGKLPSAFRSRHRGRPRRMIDTGNPSEMKCGRGHVGRYTKHADGGYRCMECRAERERPGIKKSPSEFLSGTCPKGHVDKYRKRNKPKPSGGGLLYCAECNRISRQKSRDKAKAAKIGA